MIKKKQLTALGALLLATLFWGMTFALIKSAISALSPYDFLFWRFATATLFLLLFSIKIIKREGNAPTYRAGFFLGIFLLGTVLFQTIGLKTILASTSSFITALSVILAPLFASCINKTWPKAKTVVSILLAFAGIATISLHAKLAIVGGELWTLLCAISFAIFMLLADRFIKIYHPVLLTLSQFFTITLITGFLGLVTHSLTIPQNLDVWISILFCSVFSSIFAHLLQLYYQKEVKLTTTAIIFSCEPIFATLAAMVLLSEQLTIRFYVGSALIFLAIIISELSLKKPIIPQD